LPQRVKIKVGNGKPFGGDHFGPNISSTLTERACANTTALSLWLAPKIKSRKFYKLVALFVRAASLRVALLSVFER